MKSRTESLQIARHRLFDLLVIGGGVAGAGVAQNAASRGLSVALIEKEDFSSGTSSRTTKLIHGGLRYLEQFRLKLTAQLCKERARLERLAPHMVKDFSFILPLSKKHPLFNWKMHMGLALYDLVALSSSIEHHFDSLSAEAVLQAAPALSPEGLSRGLRFHDCITDDCRIVLSVIKSACDEGAVAINYLQAKSFMMEGDRIQGLICRDRYTGEDLAIKARSYVNATGVWTDEVCKMSEPTWTNKIAPSKGVHIIVPASAFETNTALFLPTDDNRYVFVVPWQHALMIGTTDHFYDGNLDNPLPQADEIDYLLHVVNSYSNSHRLNRSDITGSFAGLRPLVRFSPTDDSSGTAGMSREHLIFETKGGLVNVAGGKLTSYRLMAEEVVDRALTKAPDLSPKHSRTGKMMLGGWRDNQDFLTRSAEIAAQARRLGIDPAIIDHLIASYGAESAAIIGLVELDEAMGERICPNYAPIMAEVVFSVQREMAVSLEDVLFRRMRLGILDQRETLNAAPEVARLMQKLLDWDEPRMQAELKAVEANIEAHMEPLLEGIKRKMSPDLYADSYKVFVSTKHPGTALERLAHLTRSTCSSSSEPITAAKLLENLQDKDGIVSVVQDKFDEALFQQCPRLKVVANVAVGFDNIDVAAATNRGILVVNTPGVLDNTTADLAFALLLSAARRLVEADSFVRAGRWQHWSSDLLLGTDVSGKTLGVIGLGRIGQAMARRSRGFDMKVLYWQRHRAPEQIERDLAAEYVGLNELLRQSDFVSLHCPLSDETYHLIGRSQLQQMKQRCILINTSRGAVIDENALVKALASGTIAGAGLDVFEWEPKVSQALLTMTNVVLAPHIGSASVETRSAMAGLAVDGLLSALAGKLPPNAVNPQCWPHFAARLFSTGFSVHLPDRG